MSLLRRSSAERELRLARRRLEDIEEIVTDIREDRAHSTHVTERYARLAALADDEMAAALGHLERASGCTARAIRLWRHILDGTEPPATT